MLSRTSLLIRRSLGERGYARKRKDDSSKVLKFDVAGYKLHGLESGPETSVEVTGDDLLHYYKQMYEIRRVETVADALYKSRLIRGFLHLYNGQEAICVGAEAAVRKEDHMITAYREHGFQLCRGDTAESVFGELLGKVTGCSKGNGGSMHMFYPEGNFHGGNGIVGAQVPIGAGVAFALKYNKTDNICMAYYGDGAANQGQLFEAYNMAVLWDLPVIFVCENNKYGMGTSIERAAAGLQFYQRGHYIPGMWIDGMDVLAVRNGVEFAAQRAREGKGPMILEMETYRYVGHSMSDPGTTYRTRSEVDDVRKTRDPIELVKRRIVENEVATVDEIKEIEKEIRASVLEAANKAKAAADPPARQLYENVYTHAEPARAVLLEDSFKL